jgi:hypothetical protein
MFASFDPSTGIESPMSGPKYEDEDDFRGYEVTKIVDASQKDVEKVTFVASHPRTGADVVAADQLEGLHEKIAALPQCYIPVCDNHYLMELTHELKGDREIIVNFVKPNDDAVLTHAKLRSDSSNDDLRGILPSDCQLSAPELAAVLELVRTPPTAPPPRK